MAVSAKELKEAELYIVEIQRDYAHPLNDRRHPQHRACKKAFRRLKAAVEAETYFVHLDNQPLNPA